MAGPGGGGARRQPSLFSSQANDPTPLDLAGLLAGPGELGRMGGTARVTVPVDAAWRVHALVAEFATRGLPANWAQDEGGSGFVVRTAYTVRLLPLARTWSDAAPGKRVPVPLHLSGHAVRLWAAAAGTFTPDGYVLRLDARDEACWPPVGAALQALGVPAALVVAGTGGPAYRVGLRRLIRLAELVGDPPAVAPPHDWPMPAAPGR
jgi:hypothetical protein